MINAIFDMETGDPDDFLTLLLLCGHPDVNLRAVTITPGAPDQVGLVRWALEQFKKDIPVGSFELNVNDRKKASRVSRWHHRAYGEIDNSYDSEEGWRVLEVNYDENTTLITGAPLKNLGKLLLMRPNKKLGKLVVQGGFAGEGVVSRDKQLDKFKGLITCPTYNLNGDPKSAIRIIDSQNFISKMFVSKNVCHGVYYNKKLHEKVEQVASESESLKLIYQGMSEYLRRRSEGKKFHDPLAACCAINPSIGVWAEVELYRERGKWGSRKLAGSGNKIIIDYDQDLFETTLLRH